MPTAAAIPPKRQKEQNMSKQKNKQKHTEYIVYTDGGCAFNPGGPGGIGVVIINTADGTRTEISQGYTMTTNNRMEILAVITALEAIPDGASVVIHSDSQYTINCMSGVWEKRKNTDLWAHMDRARKGKKIQLVWVRGHAGNPENEKCDMLATAGINSPDKLIDTGYIEEKEAGREFYLRAEAYFSERPVGGAMGVNIQVPEMFDAHPHITRPAEYAKEHNVKLSCAKAICEFYMIKGRNFKAYMALKSGGIDAHSKKDPGRISDRTENPELFLSTIRTYLPNEKDAASAARWYDRGLSLSDSIRKVLVDAEVRANCT